MTKEELFKLAEGYDKKAETARERYQESGIQRHLRDSEKHEDLADALRVAANASEDHDTLIHYRGNISRIASKILKADKDENFEEKFREAAFELISFAKQQGLIGETEAFRIEPAKEGTR